MSPRSDDRKRRVLATIAHTTEPDGALSWTIVGSDIGKGDGVGELVGLCVGVAVEDGVAEAVDEVAPLG